MNFSDLHQQSKPLLICNVWDAMSARLAEKLGFQGMGTSSAAIAQMLGYPDGEIMEFSELCYFIKQIKRVSDLPLSVDIEAGFGKDSEQIVQNIQRLAELGVVGINIEDSVVNQKRVLVNAETFAKLLAQVKEKLRHQGIEIFINVRTDVYITGENKPIVEAMKRASLYQQAGADGIFVPCIEEPEEIAQLVNNCDLPINVMCMPNLPDFKSLELLGVKRISMGNFLFDHMYQHLESSLQSILKTQSFKVVF